MDTAELEQHISMSWAEMVRDAKKSLESGDRETVEVFNSHEAVDRWLSVKGRSSSLALLRPSIRHLFEFSGIFQRIAPNLDTSYLWGSLACLLQIVSSRLQLLEHVPGMINSLALKTETFNGYYKRSHSIKNSMKEVCFAVQLQITIFLTTSIKYARAADSGNHGYHMLPQRIQVRYDKTAIELGDELSRLERLDKLDRSAILMTDQVSEPRLRFRMTPLTKISRLFDRVDVFVQLDKFLATDAREFLNSVALHGLVGIGKTSIASSYAEKKFNDLTYDVVLWVCGEKDVSLRQSFTDIAMRLKLPEASPTSHDENRALVQDWFQTSSCKWLVIFDNVESAELLGPYWPPNSLNGRAIITTRNRSLAFDPAANGIEVTSWDAETGAEFMFFLLRKSIGQDLESEMASAKSLAGKLSGHALTLSQMAGYIYESEYTIQDFMTEYQKDPYSTHARDEFARLWNMVFRSLDENSLSLLGIIAFLMPDNICPEILEPRQDLDLPENLEFLKDKMGGLATALRKLISRALVKRDRDSRTLSIHRMVQTQFRCYLTPEQRQRQFNDTVTLLSAVVPQTEAEKGQLYDQWDGYNHYLQHALYLRDIFREEKASVAEFQASRAFCDLLNSYQRYLLEKCMFTDCLDTCAVNKIAVSTLVSEVVQIDLQATILSHQAQVYEILGDANKSIDLTQQGLEVRLGEQPMQKMMIAWTYGNMGIAYCTANDLPRALECFQKAREWWDAHFEGRDDAGPYSSSMLVYEAKCMVGLGSLDIAEEMLRQATVQLLNEKPANFGDLSYAHFCHGLLDERRRKFESAEARFFEALNAWREGNETASHPFNAGITYHIGLCCLSQGKAEAASKHFQDAVEITKLRAEMLPVEHARSLFKLSQALLQSGHRDQLEVEAMQDEAKELLRKRSEGSDPTREHSYDDLISIYWR